MTLTGFCILITYLNGHFIFNKDVILKFLISYGIPVEIKRDLCVLFLKEVNE